MAFQELADGTQSKQKAEYIRHEFDTKKTKNDYIIVHYKRLDGNNPGEETKGGAFVASLSESSKDLIKAGGTFVVVKTKAGKFWNLTEVVDVSTYVEKPKSTYTGTKSYSSSTYDTTGVKVGAARNQAIAFLAATKGTKFTLDDVDAIAYEIVTRQAKQEDTVRAGVTIPKTAVVSSTNTKSVSTETTTLENIEF